MHDSIPAALKDRLIIKVEKANTIELVERALKLRGKESQYRIPWIVFDRDQVKDFDEIIQTAQRNKVNAGWLNPCFEIWMYAYFEELPVISESTNIAEYLVDKSITIIRNMGEFTLHDEVHSFHMLFIIEKLIPVSMRVKRYFKSAMTISGNI